VHVIFWWQRPIEESLDEHRIFNPAAEQRFDVIDAEQRQRHTYFDDGASRC
jgi:hypothetical protein